MSYQAPPFFILSCKRSGSTLLRYIIDTHPDICIPPELMMGDLCTFLHHMVSTLSYGEVNLNSSQEDRGRRCYAEVNRIISEWMSTYAKSRGKRLWGEKTPNNLSRLNVLKSVFPDACLHRNCMDVASSFLELMNTYNWSLMPIYYIRNRNVASACIDNWIDETNKLLTFEQENIENCIRVRYEDIVSDPIRTLKPVFEFIGVSFEPKLLDSIFTVQHDPWPGDVKVTFTKEIHDRSIGKGASISILHIADELLHKMNDLLARLDYPLVGPDWDRQAVSPYIEAFVKERDNKNNRAVAVTIDDIFERLFPKRLKAHAKRYPGKKGICKFIVRDADTHIWMIDCNIPRVFEATDGEADCTISVTLKYLIEMVSGDLDPVQAMMQGKVRVIGDLKIAINLGQILFTPEDSEDVNN
jgi:protein-tyrosine sulfotransferase